MELYRTIQALLADQLIGQQSDKFRHKVYNIYSDLLKQDKSITEGFNAARETLDTEFK